jgi:hypothetical protein
MYTKFWPENVKQGDRLETQTDMGRVYENGSQRNGTGGYGLDSIGSE